MFNQNQQNNQWDRAMDMLSVISLLIGYENLIENRSQSAQNDVQSANDKQAHYLLDELKTMFEEQNAMLQDIQQRLERLEVQNGSKV